MAQTFSNGQYLIKAKNGCYLEAQQNNSGEVIQNKYSGGASQIWQLTYNTSMGGYTLQPQWAYYKDRNMVLDVYGGQDVNAWMDIWPLGSNQKNQLFNFTANGDGTYRIVALLSSTRCLDVNGGSSSSGARIDFYPWGNQDNQKWSVEPTTGIKTFSLAKDGSTYVSSNFQVKEFACKDGTDSIPIDMALVNYLQKIRTWAGAAVTINSGYRTPAYNAKIGGASGSYHTLGQAADIVVSGKTTLDVSKQAQSLGILGIERNLSGNYVHIDTRTTKWWVYTNDGTNFTNVTSF